MRRNPLTIGGLLLLAATACSAAMAQKLPWESGTAASGGKTPAVVQFLGPEQVSVPAGTAQQVELRFRVAPGFHINSHAPHAPSLIPTQLIVNEEDGLEVASVVFPSGTDYSFSFAPDEKLSVYTGDVELHARFTARAGSHLLQGALRFQACDANSCMPPRKIPVAVSILAR